MDEASHPKRFESCYIEVFTAELTKCAAVWTFPDVSKGRISFTCRVKQSKNNGLPSIDDEGAMIMFETSGTACPAKLRHIPGELNLSTAVRT